MYVNGKSKSRGAAPHADYFLYAAKESNQRNAAPVCRRCAVPCVARLVRRLRNSRYALKQSSPKSPDQPALLGGAQGMKKQKDKTKTSGGHVAPTLCRYSRSAVSITLQKINFYRFGYTAQTKQVKHRRPKAPRQNLLVPQSNNPSSSP